MTLNDTTAIEIIKNPTSSDKIQSAKLHESQLRVFTEVMSEPELRSENYWDLLKAKMKSRSPQKFDRVIEFARYPLPVVQLSDSILNDFFKVFDGKNRYFNNDADRDVKKLNEWIQDNDPVEWIEKHAKQVFKNKPCSFVVVDVDATGIPYLIFIDSSRLIDAVFKNDEGNLEYIAFTHSVENHEIKANVITTFFSVYDDMNYFVFAQDSDGTEIRLVSSNPHNLGRCPGKAFIKSGTNSKNKFKRRVAFSSALSKLEDWTIFDIFRNYVDHYAPFPVTEAPINKCPNPECQDGKVSNEVLGDAPGTTRITWSDCEACKGADGGKHIYPGTHIGIKVQATKDLNDGSGVFKMIFPDTDKLKYVPEKLDTLELKIKYETVGVNNLMNSEAFNQLQVKGSFTSMESVLMRTKSEMDDLYKWIISTVASLLYKDISVRVEANFGSEFYLISEDELQKRYKTAKDAGLPMEELLMIYEQLIETKYKGNPSKIERQKMLLSLDPLPLYSINEAIQLKGQDLIDSFDLTLKVNFLNFITKFESENVPITQFGLALEPWKRIEKIKQILIIYTNEYIASKQVQPGG